MSVANVFILVIFACVALCAQAYVNPTRMRNSLTAIRQTKLFQLIHQAAEAGDLETVMKMINEDPALSMKYDIDGQLALHHAAKNGHLEMVKFLVEKAPGMVNFKNIRWRTPLHWAAAYAGYEGFDACEEICFYLISKGANIRAENKDTMTPIDLAKKGPLGQKFADALKKAAQGIEVKPVDIAANRVYWG